MNTPLLVVLISSLMLCSCATNTSPTELHEHQGANYFTTRERLQYVGSTADHHYFQQQDFAFLTDGLKLYKVPRSAVKLKPHNEFPFAFASKRKNRHGVDAQIDPTPPHWVHIQRYERKGVMDEMAEGKRRVFVQSPVGTSEVKASKQSGLRLKPVLDLTEPPLPPSGLNIISVKPNDPPETKLELRVGE